MLYLYPSIHNPAISATQCRVVCVCPTLLQNGIEDQEEGGGQENLDQDAGVQVLQEGLVAEEEVEEGLIQEGLVAEAQEDSDAPAPASALASSETCLAGAADDSGDSAGEDAAGDEDELTKNPDPEPAPAPAPPLAASSVGPAGVSTAKKTPAAQASGWVPGVSPRACLPDWVMAH